MFFSLKLKFVFYLSKILTADFIYLIKKNNLLLCVPIWTRRAELFTKSNERLRRDGQARCPEGDTKRELRCGQHTKSATIASVTFSWPLCMDLLSPVCLQFCSVLSCLALSASVPCLVSFPSHNSVCQNARVLCAF